MDVVMIFLIGTYCGFQKMEIDVKALEQNFWRIRVLLMVLFAFGLILWIEEKKEINEWSQSRRNLEDPKFRRLVWKPVFLNIFKCEFCDVDFAPYRGGAGEFNLCDTCRQRTDLPPIAWFARWWLWMEKKTRRRQICPYAGIAKRTQYFFGL